LVTWVIGRRGEPQRPDEKRAARKPPRPRPALKARAPLGCGELSRCFGSLLVLSRVHRDHLFNLAGALLRHTVYVWGHRSWRDFRIPPTSAIGCTPVVHRTTTKGRSGSRAVRRRPNGDRLIRAVSTPRAAASGRTGMLDKAAIPLRARNGRHRPQPTFSWLSKVIQASATEWTTKSTNARSFAGATCRER
jgi:hypothetical protein